MNPLFLALTSNARGLRLGWQMARATYWYSRGHGLTVLESLPGAWDSFIRYARKR